MNKEKILLKPNEQWEPSPCARCGSPRVFEMQLMPTLPTLLRDMSGKRTIRLEYGVVVIYTCARSCSASPRNTKSHSDANDALQVVEEGNGWLICTVSGKTYLLAQEVCLVQDVV